MVEESLRRGIGSINLKIYTAEKPVKFILLEAMNGRVSSGLLALLSRL